MINNDVNYIASVNIIAPSGVFTFDWGYLKAGGPRDVIVAVP